MIYVDPMNNVLPPTRSWWSWAVSTGCATLLALMAVFIGSHFLGGDEVQ